jgi:threonine/homoserine/homoserine lactone efflux protein
VFSSARVVKLYQRGRHLIECACGLFLIGFALRLLLQL